VVDRRDLINATNKSDAAKREKAAAAAAKTPTLRAAKPRPASGQAPASSAATEAEELVGGMSGVDGTGEPATLDWLDNIDPVEDDSLPPLQRPAVDAGRLPRDVDPEVFMLNVVGRGPEGFRGEDILHILLACDLRFGDMNFFHRHEFEAGRGAIQFSVANMMQPGVFDIDHMGDFNTPGLVFFLTLPGPEDMMKAFDYMLETAQAVARNLNGDVLDESRSVLSRQSLEHCRQQIRDLERRMLARTR
jgi:cell division protein ZipA